MYKWLKNCGKAGCAGHQTLFGDKEQGSVLMHAQVIKPRLVTKYNIKVINEFWKRGC